MMLWHGGDFRDALGRKPRHCRLTLVFTLASLVRCNKPATLLLFRCKDLSGGAGGVGRGDPRHAGQPGRAKRCRTSPCCFPVAAIAR